MAGRLAAVIGSPVAHSLSPAIHRAAFDAAGIDWSYVAFEVADGQAGAALDAMRTLGIAGLSVTMPHKTAVAERVDRLDPAARALHSVNTVSWDGDELVGSSTDGAGFVASLADAGVGVEDARVAIIGAGGAARSLVDALARAGATDITVLNRTPERAEAAAALGVRGLAGNRQRRLPCRHRGQRDQCRDGRRRRVAVCTGPAPGRAGRRRPGVPPARDPLVGRSSPNADVARSTDSGCWSTRRHCSNGSGSATMPSSTPPPCAPPPKPALAARP